MTDTEMKFGQTMPYNGPASSFGTTGRTAAAYYRMINEQGGVNGRKINFLSLDNPKAYRWTIGGDRAFVNETQAFAR